MDSGKHYWVRKWLVLAVLRVLVINRRIKHLFFVLVFFKDRLIVILVFLIRGRLGFGVSFVKDNMKLKEEKIKVTYDPKKTTYVCYKCLYKLVRVAHVG